MEAHLKSRLESIQKMLMKIIFLCEFILHPQKNLGINEALILHTSRQKIVLPDMA